MFKEADNCEAWVQKCVFLIEMGGVDSQPKKVHHLCSHLPEPIQDTVVQELAAKDTADRTVKEFIKVLNKACRKNEFQYENLLTKLKYNEETHLNLRNFYYRIKQLVVQTIGDGCEDMVDKISFKEFLHKLPRKIQNSEFLLEYRKEKTDIMDIVDKCAEFYDRMKGGEYSELNQMAKFGNGQQKKQKGHKGFNKSKKASLNQIEKKMNCYFCGIPGHKKSECRKFKKTQSGAQNSGKKEIVCYKCGKRGHKSPDCRSKPKSDAKGKTDFKPKGSKSTYDIVCHFCKKKGHKEAQCFKKNNSSGRREPSRFERS